MEQDNFYNQLVEKMREVSSLSPQTVGPFTPLYRRVIPLVKYDPWRVFVVGSLLLILALYLLFGPAIVRLTSLLQHGF